jgi:hypothetical protein
MEVLKYTAFGLNIDSSIPMPELSRRVNGDTDLAIRKGDVPEKLAHPSQFGRSWQAEPGKMLLKVNNVARFLLIGNSELIIDSSPDATEAELSTFVLGSIMGAVLHSKRILVLHASGIKTNKGAVLFTGKSGSGKSTLLASFLKRGYGMLTDDKAAIAVNSVGEAEVIPSFPFARITKISAKQLEYPVKPEWFREGMGKYIYPVEKFEQERSKVYAVFCISAFNKREIKVKELDSVAKFTAIDQGTYRKKFLNSNEDKSVHFSNVGIVANQVAGYSIKRPDRIDSINELSDLIEEII